MCGVAHEERTTVAEPLGHTMVHAIGREPVHAVDVDVHPLDYPLCHIVPGQVVAVMRDVVADGSDESHAMVAGHGEQREEIGAVERGVYVAVDSRSAGIDIGHIEQVRVGAAWKTD